jgi:hypothetical protein
MRRLFTITFLALALGMFLFTNGGLNLLAGQVLASHEYCKAEGSWIGINIGPVNTIPDLPRLIFQETFTPADPSGQNLVAVMRWENSDPTFFGFNTDVDVLTDLTGIAMRTSKDSYDIKLMAYGVETQPGTRGKIRYIVTVEGTMEFSDNCNRKVIESATVRLYDKETADQDEDGFPDEDAEPGRVSGPLQLSDAKRIH